MKTLVLLLLILVWSATTHAAATPRLAFWVTDQIGASSVEKCTLAPKSGTGSALPTFAPTLTERDVIGWNPDNGLWSLDPVRIADGGRALQDHCFVLALEGKLVSRGVVLSSHSARLVSIPTISVHRGNHATDLRLISGNNRSRARLIQVEALEAVLGGRSRQ